ncbi:MAG: TetR/AcrR family transcriptional regulator [Cyclobacteriaceae bacterium]
MENKEHIAKAAEDLFMAYGVRSVTMDDISKRLSISKKTIYQYYRDKDEIVCLVTERVLQKEKEKMDAIKEEAIDAIHELVLVSRYIRMYSQNVNPSILFDLQKYHLNAWEIFLRFKESVFIESLKDTLQKGIKEGAFRDDINIEVLALLRMEEIQMASDNEVFPQEKYDYKEVQIQLFDHFIQGILTDRGRKKLAQYLEKVEKNEI